MADTIVRLNVGGRIFETTETTLRFDGVDNFFTALLSDRTPSLKDSTGAYFIDRDPDYFTVILRFLRTRKLDVSNGLQLTALYDEALFYSLDAVAEVIMMKVTTPELSGTGDVVGPRLNGAYVNSDNTKAIVFTCCGDNDETEKRIILVEDSSKDAVPVQVDAFSQAKVARAATSLPSLWDEYNKVDYAAFFYKYIKRGKFLIRQEGGNTFLSLIVPGGEQLTQNKMAILACGGGELLFFASAAEGSFARFKFRSFSENGVDAT